MASQSTATSSPRAPFDDDDADIVFRSCDNVDFRLYRVIIAKASRVMHDMLTLPSDPSAADDASPPVVPLTETARTLEHVFRLCCPVEHPTITTLEDVHAVLEAARKYEMPAVTANLRCVITRILSTEPLRVYAIAYMLEMEDVAREAARLLLDEPSFHVPAAPPPEFEVLPARAIYAVHAYRQECAEAALRLFDNHDWLLNGDHERARLAAKTGYPWDSWCWLSGSMSSGHAPQCTMSSIQLRWSRARLTTAPKSYRTQQWWVTHLESLKSALASRPSGRTVRAHLGDPSKSEALSQTLSCNQCKPKAYTDLALFDSLLAAMVDAAVEKVNIDLPFSDVRV
ncbi:hypothetical protein K466DRAFT_665074 [Polyporus arcularius HHB13444]|uniref:BTB domain-containing protein n=1 Tax=Polyporus arcularius HHB13444 TaxID=1314778 RepID=A0A5C3P4I5_9APHY|nr:hypothetical protein K466DRAFT_665074 [Polyporus arcularius HHB13444]